MPTLLSSENQFSLHTSAAGALTCTAPAAASALPPAGAAVAEAGVSLGTRSLRLLNCAISPSKPPVAGLGVAGGASSGMYFSYVVAPAELRCISAAIKRAVKFGHDWNRDAEQLILQSCTGRSTSLVIIPVAIGQVGCCSIPSLAQQALRCGVRLVKTPDPVLENPPPPSPGHPSPPQFLDPPLQEPRTLEQAVLDWWMQNPGTLWCAQWMLWL